MTDIVERLRHTASFDLNREAADEIERLRAKVMTMDKKLVPQGNLGTLIAMTDDDPVPLYQRLRDAARSDEPMPALVRDLLFRAANALVAQHIGEPDDRHR
jgi:hypothetical protein